ncbi:MAG: hypothetical protein GXY34_07450 [Syntrophomonadaceae bacterium]|nr:hypothetical protein [Syntrophomonadaceae bacterium]
MHDYRHLIRMTDNNGMMQFSHLGVPDAGSGYTLDDNARALMLTADNEHIQELAAAYAAYLFQAQDKNGGWCNLLSNGVYYSTYDSEDSIGRALLACAVSSASCVEGIRELCHDMFKRNIPRVLSFTSPRAIAYSLLALCKYQPEAWPPYYQTLAGQLSGELIELYQLKHSQRWYWFEDYLTYCNGILPQALLAFAGVSDNRQVLAIGKDSLNFLSEVLFRNEHLDIVGNCGWYQRGGKIPIFDQQPVDAASIISVLLEAYELLGNREYLDLAQTAYEWYHGRNHHGLPLYNEVTGGCFDALTEEGVNLNQGAEAVVSLLLSDLMMEEYLVQEEIGQTLEQA